MKNTANNIGDKNQEVFSAIVSIVYVVFVVVVPIVVVMYGS